MNEGRYRAMTELAQTYFWRGEVEEKHFLAMLTVLEAMGFLAETDASKLLEITSILFPSNKSSEATEP